MEIKKLRREYAAALRYRPGEDNAPVVIAAAQGPLARKIKEIAQKEKIPVYREETLAKALYELGVGVEIPPQLYEAVAKVLVFVAELDKKNSKTRSNLSSSHS